MNNFCFSEATELTLHEIGHEVLWQDVKFGEQHHPDGTSEADYYMADVAKHITDSHAKDGTLTWKDILNEEVWEAFAEEDQAKLRAELVQVAAVAANWINDIDSRTEVAAEEAVAA